MGVSKVALEYRLRGVFSTHRFNNQSTNQPNQQRTLAAARLTHHHFGTSPVFRNNSVPRPSSPGTGDVSSLWPSLRSYCNRLSPHTVAEDTKRDKGLSVTVSVWFSTPP
jgi:hypothetical protein